MSTISNLANKNVSYKQHIIPSAITAAVVLALAIPMTAAFSGKTTSVSAATPVAAPANTCSVGSAAPTTLTSKILSTTVAPATVTTTTTQTNGNGNSGNGNGNTNGSGTQTNGNTNGSGNGNGSGSNANGNTQSNTGGLLGGVNAIVPVSLLNGSLNDVLSGNTVSVPVNVPILSGNNGNTTSVPVLSNLNVPVVTTLLNTLNSIKL